MYAFLFKTINWALNTVSVQGLALAPRQPHQYLRKVKLCAANLYLPASDVDQYSLNYQLNSVITKHYWSRARSLISVSPGPEGELD